MPAVVVAVMFGNGASGEGAGGEGEVGVGEGGAVGELDEALHVVGSGLLHAGDVEGEGGGEVRGGGLGPGVEAVGGGEAELDAGGGGRRESDGVLGDLDVVGVGKVPGATTLMVA